MVHEQDRLSGLGAATSKTLTGVQTPTGPNHILLHRQLGKPSASHTRGIPTVRKGDGAEGRRGRKKRTPPGHRAERAAHAGIPNPKGCRLPKGPHGNELKQHPNLWSSETVKPFLERTAGHPDTTWADINWHAVEGNGASAVKRGHVRRVQERLA